MVRNSPAVGIWWLYKNSIFHAEAVSVENGIRYGDCIIGTSNHAETWEKLRKSGGLSELPTELREEYFSIPRGRVVFHSDTSRFTILHGGVSKRALQKVRTFFCLPADKTDFDIDFHYQNHSELYF